MVIMLMYISALLTPMHTPPLCHHDSLVTLPDVLSPVTGGMACQSSITSSANLVLKKLQCVCHSVGPSTSILHTM